MIKLNTLTPYDLDNTHSHFDVYFTIVKDVERGMGIQGGLHDSKGDILVSVMRKGAFAFGLNTPCYVSYFAEKLHMEEVDMKNLFELWGLKEGEMLSTVIQMPKQKYILVNIGCIECGVSSDIVGIFDEDAVRDIARACKREYGWREGGQNAFKYFEVPEEDMINPQYCEIISTVQN